jgi:hypothetical protein
MKTMKLMLSLIALFVCAVCTANSIPQINAKSTERLGIPYSLTYIAEHSPQKPNAYFSDNVIFHETASMSGLSRSYDWEVTFEQNGVAVAQFTTNGSWSSWTVYSSTDEVWNSSTTYVPPGTYTVSIRDLSSYGNFYEMYANGVYVGHDVNTTRQDGVMEGVVVNAGESVDVGVNRVQ